MKCEANADDLRPRGTVQVKCSTPGCDWEFWVGALDPRLPDGPFQCPFCSGDHDHGGPIMEKA